VQQPLTGACWQALLTQVSLVHGSVSAHWLSAVQQPLTGVFWHWLLTQLSVVQGLLSLQSLFELQPQPGPWAGRTDAS